MSGDLNAALLRRQAQRELDAEKHLMAVEAEKARLRSREQRSLWRRLVDALPFTITWKKS